MLRIYCADARTHATRDNEHHAQRRHIAELCRHAAVAGCNNLLVTGRTATPADVAGPCADAGIGALLDLNLVLPSSAGQIYKTIAPWTTASPPDVLDPRRDDRRPEWRLRVANGDLPEGFIDAWADELDAWAQAGVAGVRCCRPGEMPASGWQRLISRVHEKHPGFMFLAWTPGLAPAAVDALKDAGFAATFSSLPWWDGRASWLLDEHERLARIAPVIAPAGSPDGEAPAPASADHARSRLWQAAFLGDGMLVTESVAREAGADELERINDWLKKAAQEAPAKPAFAAAGADAPAPASPKAGRKSARKTAPVAAPPSAPPSAPTSAPRRSAAHIHPLLGPQSPLVAYARVVPTPAVLVLNAGAGEPQHPDWGQVRGRLPGDLALVEDTTPPKELAPGQACLLHLTHAPSAANEPDTAPRIVIQDISPSLDNGEWPAKACIGDLVQVRATVFTEGHEHIAVRLMWRASGDIVWHEQPMEFLVNDRWDAQFRPDAIGQFEFVVKAWRDDWSTFRADVGKKVDAGQDVKLEVTEGQAIIKAAAARDVGAEVRARLISGIEAIVAAAQKSQGEAVQAMLDDDLADAMESADERPFETRSPTHKLTVDRREGRFASWYELFPRSMGSEPGVHGTLRDVIHRLPDIQAMGFDVLYFPPIHPIGMANRKGRNNALTAVPGDPGSPYAIGGPEGGHDALHPQLGTLEDFRALVSAAHAHGLEIALDFAIQCSPDHPWLKQHPEWFDWRPDGSLRYAENPPKKYQDIVNPQFYEKDGSPRMPLWQALRDVILFWIGQGVQTFRVDNPHTKPLPFWAWMTGEVKRQHPGVLFLSEAFTRPGMMYMLAKAGFSQSYTYFTWRNTRQELTEYLTELNRPPASYCFRPNFFVNTPDINPYFLQESGRTGFLIRAALATTLSGLWGMYSGFELCEAAALPGKEEYLDSEKYELRQRAWRQPGDIVQEITALNRARRLNPALQSHLGVRFHDAGNDRILFFIKTTPERDNIVLVAISLDPRAAQRATLRLPLWEWGLPDDASVRLRDAFENKTFELRGRDHPVELYPDRPFFIWTLLSEVRAQADNP